MNLGMLLSWEQVYLSKVKNQSVLQTDEEIIHYLKNEKTLDNEQIESGFSFHQFADQNFSNEEWEKVDELFEVLNEGRIKGDVDSMIEAIGTVLWEMGNMFGTNYNENYN